MDWYDSEIPLNNLPLITIPSNPYIFDPNSFGKFATFSKHFSKGFSLSFAFCFIVHRNLHLILHADTGNTRTHIVNQQLN